MKRKRLPTNGRPITTKFHGALHGGMIQCLAPGKAGAARGSKLMKIIFVLASLAFAFVCDRADAAPMHICSSDAVARAKDLLIFYRHPDETGFAGQWSVDESAVKIGSVRAIHGKQRFDVLEVWGHIYKGNYRMRLIYAQIGGKCLLMGEEIFEDAAL